MAPMSGVTDLPFRRQVRRWGAVPVFSEMIATREAVRGHFSTLRRARPDMDEAPMGVQIAGCDPQAMADGARLAQDLGAQVVDINMGCPAKKVAKGAQAGAALMRDEALAGRILEAVIQACSVPVTLKMRLGWDAQSLNAPRLARIAEQAGVAMITVHGRTRDQLYQGHADWHAIAEVVQSVSVPVIGNGDVRSLDDACSLLEQSGAAGVMVGRGAQGRPWFPAHLATALAGLGQSPDIKLPPEPGLEQVQAGMLSHLDDLLTHYTAHTGLRMSRKHMGWYAAELADRLPGTGEFRERYVREETSAGAMALIHALFDRRLGEGTREPSARRVAA
ncbi:MAG: tRNA dihydrouridine synthase DusB [Rhodospirillaceae bacterium]